MCVCDYLCVGIRVYIHYIIMYVVIGIALDVEGFFGLLFCRPKELLSY